MTTEFMQQYRIMCQAMLEAPVVHTGTWQSTDTTASPLHATYEIEDALFLMLIPESSSQLQTQMPVVNLPWAENHFQERVGGQPLNPPPSHTQWPWARHNARFQEGEQGPFSHSYPERMWPRFTEGRRITGLHGDFTQHKGKMYRSVNGMPTGEPIDVSGFPRVERRGIRFRYGDLGDLVHLLMREPLTRQAYLPIWFPEDTGTHHGGRVPCTLGYHFMMRDNRLSCRYFMRSCDLVRHFPDDVYMAARLTQWIVDQINAALGAPFLGEESRPRVDLEAGFLRMHMTSLHAFVGDKFLLEKIIGRDPVHDRIGGSSVPS